MRKAKIMILIKRQKASKENLFFEYLEVCLLPVVVPGT